MSSVTDSDVMLTTFDNPFSPFDEFDSWWKEDLRLQHDCCGILGRTALTSSVFSDEVNERIIDEAIDEIIAREPLIYRKVKRSDFEHTDTSRP